MRIKTTLYSVRVCRVMEQRLTLISDPTDEFPNNTNSSFKMRIPNGLRLEGKGWHIALLSLSLPNSDTQTAPFATGKDHLVAEINYTMLHFKGAGGVMNQVRLLDDVKRVKADDVANASTGVEYWNKVIQSIEQHVFARTYIEKKKSVDKHNDPDPQLFVKETMCPSFRWDGDDLIIRRRYPDVSNGRPVTKPISHNVLYSSFDIAYEVALQWGFITVGTNRKVVPGPNLQMNLFQDHITTTFPSRDLGLRIQGLVSMNGKSMHPEPNWDIPRGGSVLIHGAGNEYDVLWYYSIGKENWIRLSGNIEWQLTGLNATYEKIHKHVGKAVMVYSNLQQSNVVGTSKVQLLRQLVAQQGGNDGHTYVEPKHLEWLPVSTRETDIVEVQLADVTGNLLTLPQGKSMVTMALKQRL